MVKLEECGPCTLVNVGKMRSSTSGQGCKSTGAPRAQGRRAVRAREAWCWQKQSTPGCRAGLWDGREEGDRSVMQPESRPKASLWRKATCELRGRWRSTVLLFGWRLAQHTGVCRKRSQCGQESYCNGYTLVFLGTLFILLLIIYTKHITRSGRECWSSLVQLQAPAFSLDTTTHRTSKCGEDGL